MELELFFDGILASLHPLALLYVLAGIVWGIIGGALPGISASVAMSLMLPFTFGMDIMYSLPMLSAVYVGAEYGGSIPAILIKTPGTGAAAATILDGYELNRKGLGGKALCMPEVPLGILLQVAQELGALLIYEDPRTHKLAYRLGIDDIERGERCPRGGRGGEEVPQDQAGGRGRGQPPPSLSVAGVVTR